MISEKLLKYYSLNISPQTLVDIWSNPTRKFYNLEYLSTNLDKINEDFFSGKLDENTTGQLTLLFVFENIINESDKISGWGSSSEFLEGLCQDQKNPNYILLQKVLTNNTQDAQRGLEELWEGYKDIIWQGTFEQIKLWESRLKQHTTNWQKEVRTKVWETRLDYFPKNTESILELLDWIELEN
ncbi:hypothetical protein EBU71_04990 [bacterium]|nr:hypothetical protein [Candidatus Elulimicrobium humile]